MNEQVKSFKYLGVVIGEHLSKEDESKNISDK
jgi:hypothetical protein